MFQHRRSGDQTIIIFNQLLIKKQKQKKNTTSLGSWIPFCACTIITISIIEFNIFNNAINVCKVIFILLFISFLKCGNLCMILIMFILILQGVCNYFWSLWCVRSFDFYPFGLFSMKITFYEEKKSANVWCLNSAATELSSVSNDVKKQVQACTH